MPGEKKTHEENLASVCCVCARKGRKFQNVSQRIAESVVKHFHPSYDRHGGVHPTAICDTCRKACREMEDKPEQTRHRVPNLLDYSAIRPPRVATRGNTDCSCSFCSTKGYMDSRSLEGNQTRMFLKSTTKLREAYNQVGKLQKAEPTIKLLEIFSEVVSKAFGKKLDSDYKAALQSFSTAYMELNKEKPKTFTVTPKIHIVMFHVQQYLEMMNTEEEEENRGLGYMSEQAFEAVHSGMKRKW